MFTLRFLVTCLGMTLITLRFLLVLMSFLLFGSAFAQAVEPFSNTLYAFFSDPVMFSGLVLSLSTWLTELITDALKDRSEIKGWHTRGIAAGTAAILAGVGGFFGLSYFTDVGGLSGAATAAGLALASWLGADIKHRAGQLRKTGMRQEERRKVADVASDTVLQGLLASARLIPPPFSLFVSEATIRALYEAHGAEYVRALIDRTRALTVDEAQAAGEATQKDRQIPAQPVKG